MFKSFLLTIFYAAVLSALFCCSNVQSKQATALPVSKAAKGIHLVELFTSEGCSSCPPADKLLGKLKAENDSNVFVLSYHVDYWDQLGWKDPFSQAAFSDRQRQYAQHFSSESIYTPQMIINGEEEFVGSDEGRLRASLSKSNTKTMSIQATAKRKANGNVELIYSLPAAAAPLLLNAALVQPEATTQVKRGENEGRTIRHVNVVRSLKTAAAQASGVMEFSLPAEMQKTSFAVIVFAQEKASGKITGATQVSVPSLGF